MTAAHFRQSKIKLKWHPVLRRKTVLFYPKGTFKLGQWQGTNVRSFFNFKKCDVIEAKWLFFTFCHLMQSMLWIVSVTPINEALSDVVTIIATLGAHRTPRVAIIVTISDVVVKVDKWTHFCNFVGDDLGIVKQMSFWRIGDWTWQTFCYMPTTDSISQLIDGVSIVFGRLFSAIQSSHSVGNLLGIEAKLLSIVFYWMRHVPSGPRYSSRTIDRIMYPV